MIYAAAGVALAIMACIAGARIATRSPIDASPYHARVKAVIQAIPYRLARWEGEDIPVPPAAVALLRPNVLLGRQYRSERDRVQVSLVVVQCQDARDLAGHYPPICYPARGWHAASAQEGITLPGCTIGPIARYAFSRPADIHSTGLVVYNVLILPGIGPVRSMFDVREAAGNPQARAFGAAEIQMLVPADLMDSEQAGIVAELLSELQPVVQALTDRH
jgi:hypothetical protein